MVGLVVRHEGGGEALDAHAAQRRRDARAGRPGIDEDRVAPGRIEHDRVALADIEDRDPQGVVGRGPGAALPAQRRCGQTRPPLTTPGREHTVADRAPREPGGPTCA